ncbi:alpha/beta fold hydrolase [Streptomyces sp. NPDC059740]|uniref:alpha/beta fold hydrolase n=1 Tax=Streptomyces sp. NPDC059740 TaxID=3346926 RepID=UPI00364B909C
MNGRTHRPPAAGAPRPALATNPRIPLLDCDHVPGQATGRTAPGSLLLLHGFAEDKTALRPLGAALCPRGSTAVHPSLRGHGASPRPAWGYSPLDFAADLHRIADTFPRPLHVVGYSFGALVAAVTAVALGPDRIASVAVLDQSFEAVPERYEGGPWAEASHLKWNFDHTHYLDMLCTARIPVLSVLARASPVVPEPEKKRMADRRGEFFSCTVAEGDHRSFLRESAVTSLADFYGRHFPVTTFTEAIS